MHHTTVTEGRAVAIHCHAGLGRTGLAAACLLVFSGDAPGAAEAVATVRAARPGALQTPAQVLFVSVFEQYLAHLRCVFMPSSCAPKLFAGREAPLVAPLVARVRRTLTRTRSAVGGGSAAAAAAACSAAGSAEAAMAAEALVAARAPQAHRVSAGGADTAAGAAPAPAQPPPGDAPLHVVSTDSAVTEVYGDGLTIIRAAPAARAGAEAGPKGSSGGEVRWGRARRQFCPALCACIASNT
jgi:protein tyrosine phosphatase domain-containing protein 1